MSGAPANGYLLTNMYAGYYEYNTVLSVAGATLTFSYSLANNYYTRSYTSSTSKWAYQIIRIPRSFNITVNPSSSVTAPAWNGLTGGALVLDAANILTFSAPTSVISVSGLGFRGGGGKQFTGATAGNSNGAGIVTNGDYRFNSPVTTSGNTLGGSKGEGIAGTPIYLPNATNSTTTTGAAEGYINGSLGWGAPANAGGGGTDGSTIANQYNTGGGGGGNGGAGGNGGSGWDGTGGNATVYATGGQGGARFIQGGVSRLILGGGGGAGTANNSTTASEFFCSGSAGGGIIIIRAKSYAGNGAVSADGSAAADISSAGQTDAAGGGGAGGSIIIVTNQSGATGLTNVTASAKGGNGGNMTTYYSHGPGGGGGGGIIITNGTLFASNVSGGLNGKTHTCCATGNPLTDSYGSGVGTNGLLISLSSFPSLKNGNNGLSPCGVLPISLKEFKATVNDNQIVVLTWVIDHPVNVKEFAVEVGSDGLNFGKLETIQFDNRITTYTCNNYIGSSNKYYYRLKMIDDDGTFTYSQTLTVSSRIFLREIVTAYPNPSAASVTLHIQSVTSELAKIELHDNSGKLLISKRTHISSGENFIAFPDLAQLDAGLYSIGVILDNKSFSVKVIKQ